MGQSINSIKEFEQRSPQLGYISSFNTCSHVKSSLMHNPVPPKIMHERDFYMGTCLEGDSAHSLAWRGPRGDPWRSAVGMTLCHFCSFTRLRHTNLLELSSVDLRLGCFGFLWVSGGAVSGTKNDSLLTLAAVVQKSSLPR